MLVSPLPAPSPTEGEEITRLVREMQRGLDDIAALAPFVTQDCSVIRRTGQAVDWLESEIGRLRALAMALASSVSPESDGSVPPPSCRSPPDDPWIWPAASPQAGPQWEPMHVPLPIPPPPPGLPTVALPLVLSTGGSQADGSAGERLSAPLPQGVTTLFLHNLPGRCSQQHLLDFFPVADHDYDFLHMPFNAKVKRPSCYAFINFTSREAAEVFRNHWSGQWLQHGSRTQPLAVNVAKVQGLGNNIQNLQARGIQEVHKERFLPAIFSCGRRIDFHTASAQVESADVSFSRSVQGLRVAPVNGSAW